jgi:hypothetical protein
MSISTGIADLAAMIRSGDLAAAKHQAKAVLADAEPHDLAVVAHCTHILETWPKIGVLKLRAYWQSADEHDRSIIAACAPGQDDRRCQRPPGTEPIPRWNRRNMYQAPRDIRHEVRPELRRPSKRDDRSVPDAYQRERAGVDDMPPRQDRPDGYTIDYDRAALPPLHGTPCVRCWLERSSADQHRKHDDGLCEACRDAGRPGIPDLPQQHSRADAIEARCTFIAATYPQTAVRLLRRYWQQSTADTRNVITEWVKQNTITDPVAPNLQTDADQPAMCSTCGRPRRARDLNASDGLCTDCRAMEDDRPPQAPVAAA